MPTVLHYTLITKFAIMTVTTVSLLWLTVAGNKPNLLT